MNVHYAQATAIVKKAMNDQIDWELNNNWKIRLPDNQNSQIRTAMLQQNEDVLLELIQGLKDSISRGKYSRFSFSRGIILERKSLPDFGTYQHVWDCSKIKKSLTEEGMPPTKAEEEMAKEAIRVAFRE